MQIFSILDFYKKLLKSGSNPTTGALEIVKVNIGEIQDLTDISDLEIISFLVPLNHIKCILI